VVGVDIKPQPNYPFEFVEADALDVLSPGTHFGGYVLSVQFDAIHASPPCQEYSSAGKASKVTNGSVYADLYGPTRGLLGQTGVPWAIENVTAAPSRSGILLCGSMFGLPIVRHRIFETSHLILSPFVCDHVEDAITVTGHSPQRWLKGARKTVPKSEYETAMGIDWMKVSELVQAVPPAYTEFIGDQLLQHVRRAAA
jgi:DNA (cytosine-5)-methyltransferase 1